jgi:hypothetical protein
MSQQIRDPQRSCDEQGTLSKELSKRKIQYFEDQFAYKDNWESNAAAQVRRESPVIAELRTNIIVRPSPHEHWLLLISI